MTKRGAVDDGKTEQVDDSALANMGEILGVFPTAVPVQVGGKYVLSP